MRIQVLYKIAKSGADAIDSTGIEPAFQELIKALQQLVGGPNAQLSAQVNKLRLLLEKRLSSVEPPRLPKERSVWYALSIPSVLGSTAAARVARVFKQSVGDPSALLSGLTELLEDTRFVHRYLTRIVRWADDEKGGQSGDRGSVLQVTCAGRVDAKTLKELADRASDWHLILSTFAHLAGAPSESPKLLDLDRGSVLFDALVQPQTWEVMAKVLEVIANSLTLVTNLMAVRAQMAQLNVPTDAIDQQIDQRTDEVEAAALSSLKQACPAASPEDANRGAAMIAKLVVQLRDGAEVHYLPGPGATDAQTAGRIHATLERFYALRDGGAALDAPRLPEDVEASARKKDSTA